VTGNRILVFGAGYSGRVIARKLVSEKALVAGTNRSREKADLLSTDGIRGEVYAGNGLSQRLRELLLHMTHLIISIAPNESGDPVLNDLKSSTLRKLPALKGILYLSTVGVYGDHGGAWVDETAECRPTSRRSRLRLEAEAGWQRFAEDAGVPLAILRLSGIYGPGRNAFINLHHNKAKRIIKPGQVFNRIHVDDIASAALHLLRGDQSGIFNVTDDEPAPPQDLVTLAASLMGIEPPPEIPFEQANMTAMGRSFYEDCKRVSNRRLIESGYKLLYPSYREALQTMWSRHTWQA
jgi:nucleoside-diphosphate-sugar epimerase